MSEPQRRTIRTFDFPGGYSYRVEAEGDMAVKVTYSEEPGDGGPDLTVASMTFSIDDIRHIYPAMLLVVGELRAGAAEPEPLEGGGK